MEYRARLWLGRVEVQFTDEPDEEFEARVRAKVLRPRPSWREVRDSMTLREYLEKNLKPRTPEYLADVKQEAGQVAQARIEMEEL
jgi:hypothetical protein